MFLQRIQLHNWKAYGGVHTFDFPVPDGKKTTVLIGARNGFGKTSLLEAIMLCLYDIEGLRLIARADASGDDVRRRVGYRSFLESAWHEGASAAGESEMSVQLDFADPDSGQTVMVRRAWSFSANGRWLPDVAVTIEVNGRRRSPGRNDEAAPADYYRNQISKLILPSNFAPFFLFDGEQVQKLADKEMATQVRAGIEGFLGVTMLRTLGQDLDQYLAAKRSEYRDVNVGGLRELDERLAAETARLEELRRALAQTAQERAAAEEEAQRHRDRLARIGGGTVRDLARLTEEKAGLQKSIDDASQQLAELVGGAFSMALVGQPLRQSLDIRLAGEQRRSAALTAAEATKGRIGRFLDALNKAAPTFQPPLTTDQQSALKARVESAWQSLWDPPDTDCPDSFRHEWLSESDRSKIRQRLDEVARLGEARIGDLLHRINQWRQEKFRVERDIANHASFGDTLSEASVGLDQTSQRLGALAQESARLEREVRGLESALQALTAERERENSRLSAALPIIAKLERAKSIRGIIEPFISGAVADCVADIATHMTSAFQQMSHKSVVQQVRISADCEVELLTRDGFDVRAFQQSAGENQVFAFALISAIAKAAQVRFPLIIDTPLARLDENHRSRVLQHFVESVGEQVIFLSQDTEIVGNFQSAIGSRIAKTFRIDSEVRSGRRTGRAKVVPNAYF